MVHSIFSGFCVIEIVAVYEERGVYTCACGYLQFNFALCTLSLHSVYSKYEEGNRPLLCAVTYDQCIVYVYVHNMV